MTIGYLKDWTAVFNQELREWICAAPRKYCDASLAFEVD